MNCSCSGRNNEHISSERVEANDGETRDCQLVLQDKPSKQNLTINQLSDWQHYKHPIPPDIMRVSKHSSKINVDLKMKKLFKKLYSN